MKSGLTRRQVAVGAAWTLPAIALAVAAPTAAATTARNFQIIGSCGEAGGANIGFLLSASTTVDLPIGTSISVTGSHPMAPWTVTGATVEQFDDQYSPAFILTSALPAGTTMQLRSQYNVDPGGGLSVFAIVNPAPGYDPGAAIPIAAVDDIGDLCFVGP